MNPKKKIYINLITQKNLYKFNRFKGDKYKDVLSNNSFYFFRITIKGKIIIRSEFPGSHHLNQPQHFLCVVLYLKYKLTSLLPYSYFHFQ